MEYLDQTLQYIWVNNFISSYFSKVKIQESWNIRKSPSLKGNPSQLTFVLEKATEIKIFKKELVLMSGR